MDTNYTIYQYINLIKEMAIADIKLRYHGSLIGISWSLLKPVLMFAVYFVVFSKIARFDIESYPLFLLLGIILWNFFSEGTTFSLKNIETKSRILKKMYFPRTIIVVSALNIAFVNLLISLIIYFVVSLFYTIELNFNVLMLIPYLALLYLFTYGVGLLITAFGAKYRDIHHIWEVMLRIGFWATPVVYARDMIPEDYSYIYDINPLAQIIHLSREGVLFSNYPNTNEIINIIFIIILITIPSYLIYKKRSEDFAEVI